MLKRAKADMKEVGDLVSQDEEVASIETDKIDVTVTSPFAGMIEKFLVNEEDTVTVGQNIIELDTDESLRKSSSNSEAQKTVPQKSQSEDKTPAPEKKASTHEEGRKDAEKSAVLPSEKQKRSNSDKGGTALDSEEKGPPASTSLDQRPDAGANDRKEQRV